MRRRWATLALAVVLASPRPAHAQACQGPRLDRTGVVIGTYVSLQALSFVALSDDWWSTGDTTFAFVWQGSPSLNQDRLLHAYLSYHASQLGALAFDWACFSPIAAGWLGAAVGATLTLPKEIGDGVHVDKGFDVPDVLVGVLGAALPAVHRSWAPSRAFLLKFNYWPSQEYRDRVAGEPDLFSDYAGQRFFLAFNPGRLPGGAPPLPDWLGVAVGHSVTTWIAEPPMHQWYVALDLNFRGLPITAAWWPKIAAVLDQFHVPLPGIKIEAGRFSVGLF
jgi:hypothetical protein